MKSQPSGYLIRMLSLLVLSVGIIAMQGCSMVYKTTGDVLMGYGQSKMLPYVMTKDDVPMACDLGSSTALLLQSFESVGSHPEKLAVLEYTTAATCSDRLSFEAQLEYLRAMNQGNGDAAQDARIMQKRWAAVSAKRQLAAYNNAIAAYGEVSEVECPRLKTDFDKLAWMVGMISGLQALVSDTAAGGSVGVPRNIAAHAAVGAGCLDDDQWWGVPRGIQAVVWSMLPMLAPEENIDTWAMMDQAVDKGFQGGVRLSSALYAMAAYSKGDDARVKSAIREFAAHGDNINPEYKMLDAIAGSMIEGLSDILWTKATGHRTPYGELGSFWDDKPADSGIDIQGLLD